MRVLKLKQTTHDGRTKVWKIDSKSALQTFGSSRKANIVSIDTRSQKFQSAFEHRLDGWHYISFDLKDVNPDLKISKETIVHLDQSTLQFELVEKQETLVQDFDKINSAQGQEQKQLYLVLSNGRVLESAVVPPGTPYIFSIHGKKHKFNFKATTEWLQEDCEGFTVKSKLIGVESVKNLSHIPRNEVLDDQSKKTLVITLAITSLFVFLSFLSPQKQAVVEEIALPKTATNVVFKTEKKKPVQQAQQKAQKSPQVAQEPKEAKGTAGAASGGKLSAMLKGAVGVRISKLIGKVSATEARTANVIVTQSGVKAGQGESGRALAAVGKVESSGRNWTGETAGKGTGVSTAGVGGGNGMGSLAGGLGQGKTGSGGVGLIEDESEVTGGLDREVIAQYIKTQLGQILYCYERQLSANPDLYGKVAVKFTISGNGQVEAQSINDSTLKNTSVEGCILNKVARWKFPEPKGGTKVMVTYPFLFKSTN